MISKRNAEHKGLKFLIINPFGIGDVLFTTPAIKAIKQNLPDSFIGYWSNLRVSPLLKNIPGIDIVFAANRGDLKKAFRASFISGVLLSLKLLRDIKKEGFDICLDFSLDHRYSLFAKLIGIKKRLGFNYKNRGKFLTGRIDIAGYQDKHVIEYYLELLNLLKIPAKDKEMALSVPEKNRLKAEGIFSSNGINEKDLVIAIAPGAGGSWGNNAHFKHWPAVKFAKAADLLINQFQAKILILGDDSEKNIAEVIKFSMTNKPVDLTGRIELQLLPAVIKGCRLLITNDGGPMHIAKALGVKTVSIFGPVSEISYGPFPVSQDNLVLKSDPPCRPCYRNFHLPICELDKQCLKSVSIEEVLQASRKLLA